MQRLDGVADLCASLCLHLLLAVESSHHQVDVTAGLQHLRLRLHQLTKQRRKELAQLRSQVRCELLHFSDTFGHQASKDVQDSVLPLQVAHQQTELGRLQRQQQSAGRPWSTAKR